MRDRDFDVLQGVRMLPFLSCQESISFDDYRLLELIVINLALQAGVYSTEVFAMFVVHAVVLTFFITPVTALIYPERHYRHTRSEETSAQPVDTASNEKVGDV